MGVHVPVQPNAQCHEIYTYVLMERLLDVSVSGRQWLQQDVPQQFNQRELEMQMDEAVGARAEAVMARDDTGHKAL